MPFNTLVGEANYWANKELWTKSVTVFLHSVDWVHPLLALTGNANLCYKCIYSHVQFTIIIIILHIVFK